MFSAYAYMHMFNDLDDDVGLVACCAACESQCVWPSVEWLPPLVVGEVPPYTHGRAQGSGRFSLASTVGVEAEA